MLPSRQVPFAPNAVNTDFSFNLKGKLKDENADWYTVLSCAVEFPASYFLEALDEIIQHPEYNSSIILRAEVLEDVSDSENATNMLSVELFTPTRHIRRLILPRRPDRDGSLEQDCFFLHTDAADRSLVVLVPRLADGPAEPLPFYHPRVRAIAFQHIANSQSEQYTLSLSIIPLEKSDASYASPDSRLHRICVSLAESVWRVGYGKMTGYQKKVHHDVIIDKAEYQDFYLVMRERFKSVVESWQLDTDPLKHVYEDIGIASFIILLWKHTYPPRSAVTNDCDNEPWHAWGRPPGGWLDLGCGNGLLVNILVSMGYEDGHGVDLRSRVTWTEFPPLIQEHLHVQALDPTEIDQDRSSVPFLHENGFIIGNHSDEMTPWLPILARIANASFLSIPCCPWNLDNKFTKPKGFSKREKGGAEEDLERKLEARGTGGSKSLYATYLQWHFGEAIRYGFAPETEVLRIPSSRNWAIIGRERREKSEEEKRAFVQAALYTISQVRERGVFKTRIPEGKGHGH